MLYTVQPLPQLFAGSEKRRALFFHRHGLASARIAALPRGANLHRKRPKAAKFHTMAFGQSFGDFIQHSRNNTFDVPMIQVWITLRQTRNKFGLDHPPGP